MVIKDWNGFKKSGDTYIPNDATARAGVTATVDLLKDTTGWTGKSKVPNTASSTSSGNVAFTVNANKTVQVVANNNSAYQALTINSNIGDYLEVGKTYTLCGTPLKPSGATYRQFELRIRKNSNNDVVASDVGNAVEFTYTQEMAQADTYRLDIAIFDGTTYDGLFAPMITTPEEYKLSPTYEPYHESVEDWYWSENAKTGVHQFMPFDMNLMKNANPDGTWNGNVFTVNGGTFTVDFDNNTVTVNGTFSATSELRFFHRLLNSFRFPNGNYILSGGINNDVYVAVVCTRNGAYYFYTQSTGDDAPFTVLPTDGNSALSITVKAGTYNNIVMSPLVRLADDTYKEVTPYAMTNSELTEKVQELNGYEDVVSLESGLSLWTINKVVKYGKVCTLNLSITASTAITESALIGTLPSGFRPKAIIFVPVGHPNYSGVAKIDTNGEITFTPPTGVSVTNICIVTTFVL